MNTDIWSIVAEYCNEFTKYRLWNTSQIFRQIIRRQHEGDLFVLRYRNKKLNYMKIAKNSVIYYCMHEGQRMLLMKSPGQTHTWYSAGREVDDIWAANKFEVVTKDNVDEFMCVLENRVLDCVLDCVFYYDIETMMLVVTDTNKTYLASINELSILKDSYGHITRHARIIDDRIIDMANYTDTTITDTEICWETEDMKHSLFDEKTNTILHRLPGHMFVYNRMEVLYDYKQEDNDINRPIFIVTGHFD